ncbi:MAG: enolase C-terminal domain-like protein, partial [Halobacteriales archaeon]|nr:enolase C-terminal domain-like protein [Halobacteriales archaeon]
DIGVCELIGGPANPEPVRAYASRPSRETDVEEEVAVCRDYHDEYGIGAFKFKIGKRLGFDTDEDEWPGRTESIVSGVRIGLDDDVDVLVDANGGFSPDRAIEVGTEVLDPNGVIHFEEPCPYWELDWTARVRDGVDVPVAGGEQDNMFRHWAKQWERIIETPVLDIVQPDVGYVGGLTRAKQITDLAATHGLPAVPHSPNHTLLKVFTLHLPAAIDNPGPYPFEWRDKAWHHSPRTEGLYDPEPTIDDGALAVPEGPGWGVEIGRDWLGEARIDRSEA